MRLQARVPGLAHHLIGLLALLLEGRRGRAVPGQDGLRPPQLGWQPATRLRERLAGFLRAGRGRAARGSAARRPRAGRDRARARASRRPARARDPCFECAYALARISRAGTFSGSRSRMRPVILDDFVEVAAAERQEGELQPGRNQPLGIVHRLAQRPHGEVRLGEHERLSVEVVHLRIVRVRREQLPQRLDRSPRSLPPPAAGGWLRGDRRDCNREREARRTTRPRAGGGDDCEEKPIECRNASREYRRHVRAGTRDAALVCPPCGSRLLAQRWPWLVAAGLVVVAFVSMVVEIRLPGDWDRRPRGTAEDIAQLRDRNDLNVLFILIDTLRADRLGSYGYARDTSPVLDRLASSGVRFGRHLAQSTWTKASMASLWTGLYPARTGITRYDDVIPEAARMPAEILHEAGFQTIGLWRNGWVAPTFGFDQGFEVYQRPDLDAAAAERPAGRTRRSVREGHRREPVRRRRGVPARQRPRSAGSSICT